MWQDIYYSTVFFIVAGFAIYDIYKRKVPDKALVFFCMVAFAMPIFNALEPTSGVHDWIYFLSPFLSSLFGAAVGFIILLMTAIVSENGDGIGGGDIKLAAVVGFIYGPFGITGILLIASLLALPAGLISRIWSGSQIIRLPFVPFIAIGVLTVTIFRFL